MSNKENDKTKEEKKERKVIKFYWSDTTERKQECLHRKQRMFRDEDKVESSEVIAVYDESNYEN